MSVEGVIGDEEYSRLHRRLMTGGLAVGVGVVGALVSGFLALAVLVGLSVNGQSGNPTGATVVALTIATELGYAAAGLGYLVVLADGVPITRPSGRELAAGVLGSVALVAVGQGILHLVPGAGIDDVSSAFAQAGLDPWVFLALAVVAVVLVGPAEELLFRGAVQGTLRRTFGPRASILGASVLFTAFHLSPVAATSPRAALAALAVVFLVSLVLGYAFDRTGSLAVPIVVHSLYDGLLLVAGYLVATGALTFG